MPGRLIIYRGLPGSGKTTKSKKYCVEQIIAGNINIINIDRDMFRIAVGLELTPGVYEDSVNLIQDTMIESFLQRGWLNHQPTLIHVQ
jgi:tRNA uridine 5-carbamoylmethylation protein Kti12